MGMANPSFSGRFASHSTALITCWPAHHLGHADCQNVSTMRSV
jgi:hypothetical protein